MGMNEGHGEVGTGDFPSEIESLLGADKPVSCEHLQQAFDSLNWKQLSISQVRMLTTLAADQSSRWTVEWLFSSAAAPNAVAEREAKDWRGWYDVGSKVLEDNFPGIAQILEQHRRQSLSVHGMEARLALFEGRPIARLRGVVLSALAQRLYNLGAHNRAKAFFNAALYPKGSVGRAL